MGNRKNKNRDRKPKINLVFDENKRKDFLCGFRKRKMERKKKAKEELERMLKEEKKRIKQENKESYKKLVLSSRPIPDIEQLLQDEYEDEDVNVKIVELSADTLQKKDLVIGENKPREKEVKKVTKKKDISTQFVPGMDSEDGSEIENQSDTEDKESVKTKKEIKRMLKKQATKKIQKSQVFKMKSKLDRVQNKKKSIQKKGHTGKLKNNPRKEKSKKVVRKRKK